jgi:hypothetical protein
MTILLAKSAQEVADSMEHGPFDIVTCPQPVSGDFEVIPTVLFTKPFIDSTGTVIRSVDKERLDHVASIVDTAIRRALALNSTEAIYILSGDVMPQTGWRERLSAAITDGVGMACAIVPDPSNTGYVKAGPSFGLHYETSVQTINKPEVIYSGTIDCCAITPAAAQLMLPVNAVRESLEVSIADSMLDNNLSIVLVPNSMCWLRL